MTTEPSTRAVAQLDIEGRRLVEMTLDQAATRHLQPAITQALRCLDRGLELSCSASSEIENFLKLHIHADDILSTCTQGLHWLILRLGAQDAVREISIRTWVHQIRILEPLVEHSLRTLADALDAGLCAVAMDTPLDTKYRDTLTDWLTDDCDPAHKKAVQQLLKQCS